MVELGGTVLTPPMQVMDKGYLAFFQDPTGAAFGVWQPLEHFGAGWVNSPGGFSWNELYTSDVARAKTFYEELFGWTFTSSRMGDREYWSIRLGDAPNGGMMVLDPSWGEAPPRWSVYFSVASLGASVEKARKLGAQTIGPSTQVPDIGTFVGIADPQGAVSMLIEMEAR